MDLDLLGWDGDFAGQFAPWADAGHLPGRVIAAHRGADLVATGAGELLARTSGRLRHLAGPSVAGLPAVGDWVAVRDGRIHAVLPRRTAVTRRAPGSPTVEQVLAANVDLVVAVVAPGRDANPRRVERLLALAWESGAQPVVVLGRADLCPDWGTDVGTELAGLAAVAPGVQVLALSCYTGEGVDEIAALLTPGRTAVLLGSSGVGKSTLVNRLAGRDLLATGEIREDGKGRHTTTTRQLVVLADGGLVISRRRRAGGRGRAASGWRRCSRRRGRHDPPPGSSPAPRHGRAGDRAAGQWFVPGLGAGSIPGRRWLPAWRLSSGAPAGVSASGTPGSAAGTARSSW